MKIKKGLSDADMLRGFSEEITFENGIYAEEQTAKSRLKAPKAAAKKELLLPEEEQERLNRFLLEISMECLKNKMPCAFKVAREGSTVVIRPVQNKK